MPEIVTIGVDIAKNVFQLHGVDRSGKIVLRKALRRSQVPGFFSTLAPCLIGLEACATAHHWARTLMAFGHDVRLIPPAYVKPYLRRRRMLRTRRRSARPSHGRRCASSRSRARSNRAPSCCMEPAIF